MTIRKAAFTDIPQMMEIFAIARRFMAETGNPNPWARQSERSGLSMFSISQIEKGHNTSILSLVHEYEK